MALETETAGSKRADASSPRSEASSDNLLEVYLADHRAGTEAGVARSKRFAVVNADRVICDAAHDVSRQIAADAHTLDEILDRFGCRPSRWKNVLARTGELLVAGILAKESLWQTLAVVQPHRSELSGFDFDALRHRAMQQRMQLESHRRATVTEA